MGSIGSAGATQSPALPGRGCQWLYEKKGVESFMKMTKSRKCWVIEGQNSLSSFDLKD
jgi:hypothetical protein